MDDAVSMSAQHYCLGVIAVGVRLLCGLVDTEVSLLR